MNDQINLFAFTRMTLGSTCDFHSKVGKEINATGAETLHIDGLMPAYEQVIADLQSVVNRQKAFVATPAMKEKDQARDRLVGIIINVTNMHTNSPIAVKQAAAALLKTKLSPYIGIGRHEYSKESAEINGMIAVLSLPEQVEAIATLHLDEEVKALKEANAAFSEAFGGKVDEALGRRPQTSISSSELCDRANSLYSQIVRTVNAYAIVQPSDAINTFIGRINVLSDLYATIAGTSKPSSDSSYTPGDPTNPNPDDKDDGPVIV